RASRATPRCCPYFNGAPSLDGGERGSCRHPSPTPQDFNGAPSLDGGERGSCRHPSPTPQDFNGAPSLDGGELRCCLLLAPALLPLQWGPVSRRGGACNLDPAAQCGFRCFNGAPSLDRGEPVNDA